MPFSRTPEFFRIDALLTAAEHDDELERGLLSAKQASELAPDGIRYRLLLARAELASGSPGRARAQVEAILAIDPNHPDAATLLTALDEAKATVDAGSVVDAAAAGDAGTEAVVGVATDAGTAADAAADAAAEAETGTVAETAAATGTVAERETTKPRRKPSASTSKRRSRSAERPEYDEYDRLAKAAASDAFIDGRPPLRDFGWYMREGEASLAGGDYIKARAFFDSALESRPGSGDATDALGRVAFASGDYELSLRYFRSAAQRGHPDGYYNLGRAYEQLGRKDEAVSSYYTYLKRRPSGTHVAAARSAIKNLDPRVKLPESGAEAESKSIVEPEPEPDTESGSEAPSEPTPKSETPSP